MSLILPSFELIPGKFNVGSLFAQIPMDGSADLTVTRGSNATRFNASGNVQVMGSGIPRLDYYTSGGVTGCPALLVEPAGTNLAFNSQTWATANNWALDGVTIATATSGTTAPDGTSTANAISPTSGNVAHLFYSNQPTQITYTSGTIYTQSAFFKQGTGVAGRYVQLSYFGARFGQEGYANFDLQNGVVTASGGTADPNRNARIENYGNGWYRCIFTATCTSNGSTAGVLPILINASGMTRNQAVVGFSGTVTDVLYGWGAQLETGSVATSYIPTTTGTVSRAADVISVTGAVSGSIGQTEGTIYLEMQADSAGTGANFLIIGDGVNADDFVYLGKNGANLQAVVRSNNSSVVSFTQALTGNAIKAAIAYKGGDSALYVNGSFVASGSTAFTFSSLLPSIGLGVSSFAFAAPTAINRYRAAALYNTRLTNAQLEFLTSPYTSYSQMATTLSYTIL